VNLRNLSVIQWALAGSLAAHAVLLTLRFVDPVSFNRVFADTPLEVILVNARTQDKPEKALAVAQASMAGGGEAATMTVRATSPLPPSLVSAPGETDEEAALRQLKALEEKQNLMLTESKQLLAAMPPSDPKVANTTPEQAEREQKRRQLTDLLAEIESRINQENARPKKRYVSPDTTEVSYAVYYDKLRHAIEDKGTANFPQADGAKLYGELTMVITVNLDGQVLDAKVVKSSGNPKLDRRAQAIVRSAGPFGDFTPGMRRAADQIKVVSRFTFTRNDTLETKLSGK
jgi:protein TonB